VAESWRRSWSKFTPAFQAAELRKTFAACDPNGDGRSDPEEFYAVKETRRDVSREECRLDFDAADTDGRRTY